MRKIVPAFLIAAFAAAVFFLLKAVPTMEEQPLEPISLPQTWHEFQQKSFLTDDDALSAFDSEHRKRIPIKQGVKAEYSDGKSTFHAWVASGANDAHAQQMVQDMTTTIGNAHERFSEPKPAEMEGMTVYRTDGQGLVNFFFVKGRNIYYFGIQSDDPEALIRELIKDFDA